MEEEEAEADRGPTAARSLAEEGDNRPRLRSLDSRLSRFLSPTSSSVSWPRCLEGGTAKLIGF